MPILKIVVGRKTVGDIRDYVTRADKASPEYHLASGCCIETAEQDFRDVAKSYEDPKHPHIREYYHIMVSYSSKKDHIPQAEIARMAEELCHDTQIDDYQWFSAVHHDKPNHLHAHIVVGNCAIKDDEARGIKIGRSFHSTEAFRAELFEKANELCRERGYTHSIIIPGNEREVFETTKEFRLRENGGTPWKDVLRADIDNARQRAGNLEEFKNLLWEEHEIEVLENKKGELRYVPSTFTETDKGTIKPCHQRRLGSNYGKEYLLNYFKEKEQINERRAYEKEHDQGRELEG